MNIIHYIPSSKIKDTFAVNIAQNKKKIDPTLVFIELENKHQNNKPE